MTHTIRNNRPGHLVIGLTNISLKPGETREVDSLSEGLLYAASKGHITIESPSEKAAQEADQVAAPAPDEHSGEMIPDHHEDPLAEDEHFEGEDLDDEDDEESAAISLSEMNATDAVTFIGMVQSPETLRELEAEETRKTVLAAITKRLKALEG